MDRILVVFIVVPWLVSVIGQLLNWLYWVQVKEYRIDRFVVLLGSKDGKRSLSLGLFSVKLLLLAVAFIFPSMLLVALTFFVILDIGFFVDFTQRKLRKPVFTERVWNIVFTVISFILPMIFLIFVFPSNIILWMLLGEVFLPISILIGIIWTVALVNKAKEKDIALATSKLRRINPYVIGITGSYGKSTTKEFIASLLSLKYKTLKTPENKNTEFGVARAIVSSLEPETQMFVCEMGAYKLGEIEKISKIVSPSAGIITGIEPQHLAIFGSLENIMKTKYELIKSLPSGGIAIFNYSNPFSREMAKWAKKEKGLKVYGYKLKNKNNLKVTADIDSKILSADENGVSFEVNYGGEKVRFSAAVHGVHFVENLTCAILVAKLLDISWKDIKRGVSNISSSEKTMTVKRKKSGIVVVDDSYNTTPHGFEAGLEYLKFFKNYTKIVITPGVIELGKLSENIHEDLGKKMALVADKVVLTSSDYYSSIRSGLGKDSSVLEVVREKKDLQLILDNLPKKNVALLIEGRIPEGLKKLIDNL